MSSIRNLLGIVAAVILVIAYSSYFVVDERQKALVLRFGEINRTVDEPGLYFKLPFADSVTLIEDRILIWENNDRPVQDVASQVYIVDAITLARISNTQTLPRNAWCRPGAGRGTGCGTPGFRFAPDLWTAFF